MKKKLKKLLIFICFCTMIVVSISTMSNYNDKHGRMPTSLEIIPYSDGTAHVIDTFKYGNVVKIPETYQGKRVTKICANAFWAKSPNGYFDKVYIPSTVTDIHPDAFSFSIGEFFVDEDNEHFYAKDGHLYKKTGELVKLALYRKNVIIPEGITSLPAINSTVKNLTLPSTLNKIELSDFNRAKNLKHIEMAQDNPYYKVENGILIDTRTNTTILIPPKMEKVVIPQGVEHVDNYAAGARSYSEYAIYENKYESDYNKIRRYKTLSIPDSVKTIKDAAFNNARALKKVTFPQSMQSIGSFAFVFCSSLKTVKLPQYIENIGGVAFGGCYSLKKVTLPTNLTQISYSLFEDCKSLKSVKIPETVTRIEKYAFEDCKTLKKISIPSSVADMGTEVFTRCKKLTIYVNGINSSSENWHVNWNPSNRPVKINTIDGNHTHNYILEIPESTYLISEATCTQKATYYKSCPCGEMGTEIFESDYIKEHNYLASGICVNCGAKRPSAEVNYELNSDGMSYCVTGLKTRKVTDIIIASVYKNKPVTSIGYSAFYNYSNLRSITIPDSVTSIGAAAFWGCSGLTSIVLPNSVISIGNSTFYKCSSLTSIVLPNSVTSIGNKAFSNCTNLKSVTIGNSVTSIGNYAFSDCTNLKSVTIGNSVTSIGNYAFENCSKLISIEIPDSVISIGDLAFSNCRSLTSVIIGNGVLYIGYNTFGYCINLKNVTISNSVTSIGNYAFYYCDSLTSVIFENPNGWVVDNVNQISAEELADPVTAAYYLRNSYLEYSWVRQ